LEIPLIVRLEDKLRQT